MHPDVLFSFSRGGWRNRINSIRIDRGCMIISSLEFTVISKLSKTFCQHLVLLLWMSDLLANFRNPTFASDLLICSKAQQAWQVTLNHIIGLNFLCQIATGKIRMNQFDRHIERNKIVLLNATRIDGSKNEGKYTQWKKYVKLWVINKSLVDR